MDSHLPYLRHSVHDGRSRIDFYAREPEQFQRLHASGEIQAGTIKWELKKVRGAEAHCAATRPGFCANLGAKLFHLPSICHLFENFSSERRRRRSSWGIENRAGHHRAQGGGRRLEQAKNELEARVLDRTRQLQRGAGFQIRKASQGDPPEISLARTGV
jgi:hypothetical protein